jgi:hypothetical protein
MDSWHSEGKALKPCTLQRRRRATWHKLNTKLSGELRIYRSIHLLAHPEENTPETLSKRMPALWPSGQDRTVHCYDVDVT